MSNQSRYALLSTDLDSEEEDQNMSVNEESDNSEQEDVNSSTNNTNTHSSNSNKLVYSVDTLRSLNTNDLQSITLDVSYTVETVSSRRPMHNKRNNNQNSTRKPRTRKFDDHVPTDDLSKQNESKKNSNPTEPTEPTEPIKPIDNESANNHLEQILKESEEKLKKNERELEEGKIYDKGKNQSYSVTVGLNPEAILLQSAHNRNIEMTAGEMTSLCSCPSILQEVQEEQKSESKPWKYVDIHGMHKGPYSSYEMRLLWEEGLITDNLLLCYNDNGWRPLYGYYISQKDAFIEEPTKRIRNPIPKTVRNLMRQKEMEPVKSVEPVESAKPVEPVEPIEPAKPMEPVEHKSTQKEVLSEESTVKKSVSKYSRGKPTPEITSQLFSLRKGYDETPEITQPASLPITPPENAVSLNEALMLQSEEMEQEVKESTKVPKKSIPLPQSNKDIPTLNLERDAPRIQNDTALFYVEEATPKKVEPVKPKEPVISPWTKQRLDKKPTIDRSIDYSERIGRDIQPDEPVNVWEKKTRDLSSVNYSATVGIALPVEEEKKTWKPVAVQTAVPLEELLREEKQQQQQQKQAENLLVPKEKGKKGKREWKPVDLTAKPSSSPYATTTSTATSNVLAGRKSFKEILEEQEQEKKKTTSLKAAPSKMNWASIFSNNLPSLNASKPTYQSKPTTTMNTRVEEESFWDIAKRKVEEKEVKKPVERKESKKNVNMITRDEFDNWCRKEMMKLSGSDDISLLDFCISLDDSQVLSYLQDYLGQSKEVTSFAKSFIQKKQHLIE